MAKNSAIGMNLPTVDDLFSTQEERERAGQESVRNIPLTEISDFPGHPFR